MEGETDNCQMVAVRDEVGRTAADHPGAEDRIGNSPGRVAGRAARW